MSESELAKQAFKEKYINKPIRVVTKNGRRFEGIFKAIDFRSNLIIHNAVAEIPTEHNCPLNMQLQTLLDAKLVVPKGASEQEKHEYIGTHYYIDSIMISGDDILEVEIKTEEPLSDSPA